MNKKINRRALVVNEATNMYWGMHLRTYDTAEKALTEGRDIIVHHSHYDGQRYSYYKYKVTNLRYDGDNIIGDYVVSDLKKEKWMATKELCDYAKTGKI